jgi:hypothetical protein
MYTYALRGWYSQIPLIWDEYAGPQEDEHSKRIQNWHKNTTEWEKKHRLSYRQQQNDAAAAALDPTDPSHLPAEKKKKKSAKCDPKVAPPPPKRPEQRMYKGEDILFLKFTTSLKIITSEALTKEELTRADCLLKEYLLEFKEVRLPSCLILATFYLIYRE